MKRTKEQLENAINSSPFLLMREESGMEAEYAAAFRRFTGDLYEYADAFAFGDGILSEFGVEFMQTVKLCLAGYDKAMPFLNYFISSLSTNIKRVRAKRQIDERRMGVNIGKKQDAVVRAVFRYADSKGLDVYDEYVQQRISERFNIAIDVVREALIANYEAAPISNIATTDDGEIDLFDSVIDKSSSLEQRILYEDGFIEIVDGLEKAYAACRKDTQRTVRYKLTALLISVLDGDDERIHKIKRRISFFTDEVYDFYKSEGEVPKDNQLAAMCGVLPPSFSRAYDTFKTKLTELRKY